MKHSTKNGALPRPDVLTEEHSGVQDRARTHAASQEAARLLLDGPDDAEAGAAAWALLEAGATLVQVYTGLVYGGPGLARSIVRGVGERMKAAAEQRDVE